MARPRQRGCPLVAGCITATAHSLTIAGQNKCVNLANTVALLHHRLQLRTTGKHRFQLHIRLLVCWERCNFPSPLTQLHST